VGFLEVLWIDIIDFYSYLLNSSASSAAASTGCWVGSGCKAFVCGWVLASRWRGVGTGSSG
jgi:hypothetical protein